MIIRTKSFRDQFSDEDRAIVNQLLSRQRKQIRVTCQWNRNNPKMCIVTRDPDSLHQQGSDTNYDGSVQKWMYNYLCHQPHGLWRDLLDTLTESNDDSRSTKIQTVLLSVGPFYEITLYFFSDIKDLNYSEIDLLFQQSMGGTFSAFQHDFVRRLALIGISEIENSIQRDVAEPDFSILDVVNDQAYMSIEMADNPNTIPWSAFRAKGGPLHEIHHKVIFVNKK
jgi:hypothetical protein